MSVNSKMTAIADAIRAKTGKTAPLSLDQMATEIEGISGGTELFAAIGVTYPVGSTVTCTNGTKTLTAKTTSGQWVFAIPEAGTWTVTATDGTETASETVEITAEGQSASVELNYSFVLFENGVANPLLGAFQAVSASSISDGKIKTSKSMADGNYWTFANALPLGTYGNTLHVLAHITDSFKYPWRVGAFSSKPTAGTYERLVSSAKAATIIDGTNDGFTEYVVDFSNLGTANYYLSGISISSSEISEIWIDEG